MGVNIGTFPVEMHTKYTYKSEGGYISNEGREALNHYLHVQSLPCLCDANFDWRWHVQRGVIAGNFPKRYRKWAHKQHHREISDKQLEAIGNIARRYVDKGGVMTFDFTDVFDWNAGDFNESTGSCFWGGRRKARALLESNDGLAIRFYHEDQEDDLLAAGTSYGHFGSGAGIGRAWIVPKADNLFLIFNAYGPHSTFAIANLLALLSGLTFKALNLYNNDVTGGLLYINSGNGIALGTPEALEAIGDTYDLTLDERPFLKACAGCSNGIPFGDDEGHDYRGERYCNSCYHNMVTCNGCGTRALSHDLTSITLSDDSELDVCPECLRARYLQCEHCDLYYRHNEGVATEVGHVCGHCYYRNSETCHHCGDLHMVEVLTDYGGGLTCMSCANILMPDTAVETVSPVLQTTATPAPHWSALVLPDTPTAEVNVLREALHQIAHGREPNVTAHDLPPMPHLLADHEAWMTWLNQPITRPDIYGDNGFIDEDEVTDLGQGWITPTNDHIDF